MTNFEGCQIVNVLVLVSGDPTCSWSVSACRRLPPSAFNQSSISSSCCFPLNSVVPSPADVLLVQTARKSNTPFERHKGFKAGETFWKVANPSFHFAQTPRPGGSRGLDGAIGNLCHKGIMCTESTVLQLYTLAQYTIIESGVLWKERQGGIRDNVYRIPLRVHWYYFKGKLYPMWPCRLQSPTKRNTYIKRYNPI